MRSLSFVVLVVALASALAACSGNARRDPNAPISRHDPENRRSLR
jgi:hypothetical protein